MHISRIAAIFITVAAFSAVAGDDSSGPIKYKINLEDACGPDQTL